MLNVFASHSKDVLIYRATSIFFRPVRVTLPLFRWIVIVLLVFKIKMIIIITSFSYAIA